MTKTITRDDVLRYVFKETSEDENLAIEKQLILNSGLMDFYAETNETVKKVQDFQLEPSENVTNYIIEYSDSLRVESIS